MPIKVFAFLAQQCGIDFKILARSVCGIWPYLADLQRFRRSYKGKLALRPYLHDRYEEGGSARGEYFIQDLYVARKIYAMNPRRHVDVGSRIDGFVAHVASYRPIEVWDIRPVASKVTGIAFRQTDLMQEESVPAAYCDSLSCLHALEHFGLGRYGDPIDAEGSKKGLRNMAAALRQGGTLYLAVPVGQERVQFNSQRIFDPATITAWASDAGLSLREFATVDLDDTLIEHRDFVSAFASARAQPYCLAIFVFSRVLPTALDTTHDAHH